MILQNIHLFTIIAPLLLGFLSFAVKDKGGKVANYAFLFACVVMFAITLTSIYKLNLLNGKTYYNVMGGWNKAIGIELKITLMRVFCSASVFLIATIFLAINIEGTISYAIRGFAFIMLCGANGMIMTNDIFNTYVFFEIVCITSYIFYAHTNKAECIKNTYNYLILSGFASVIFLLVAGILYQITGQLNLDLINQKLLSFKNNRTLNALYIMFILSMMFKLGVYPLHNIVFGIYKHLSPRYLSMVSGISAIVYPFFILKFIVLLFGTNISGNNEYLDLSLKLFGGIGFVFFSLMAFTTKYFLNFIISLAFAQTSMFAFCISYLPEKIIVIGIVLSITSHAILKVCLLGLIDKMSINCNIWKIKKEDLCNIEPIFNKYVLSLLVFLISGMPLSIVFISKWYILTGVLNTSEHIIWIILLLIGFALDIIACFSLIMRILMKNNNNTLKLTMQKNYILLSILITAMAFVIISTFYTYSFKLSQI